MKAPLTLLAIAIVFAVLSVINLTSCQKENITPEIGQSYHIKDNVFNKGAYQPKQPVIVDSLYTDPNTGLPYAMCRAAVNWDEFTLIERSGVAKKTIEANNILIKGNMVYGDEKVINWEIPVADLK